MIPKNERNYANEGIEHFLPLEKRIKMVNLSITTNPAGDYIEICAGDRPLKDAVFNINNVLGQCVLTLTPTLSLKGEEVKIDVSGLPAGIYFVRVGGQMLKFVKM